MQIDMKVVDKGLQGKGHKDPFIKLAADAGIQIYAQQFCAGGVVHCGAQPESANTGARG